MAETLYNRDILRLASQLVSNSSLSVNDQNYHIGHAEKTSAICGSKASVEVATDDDGRIIDAIFDVRSCAMGQASTALLIETMRGQNHDDIFNMRAALTMRLNGEDSNIDLWPKLSLLDVAVGYSARHGAILLPYDILLNAIERVEGNS